ncbi:MAG: SCO family protein [Actinomycetota bacterium]|nr:SCO family protein [Actinomycetota bacterium]
MAFAILEPVQVLPRIRLAPGFTLVDQNGGTITSEDGKGAVTLYAFAPVDCGEECDSIYQTMREVGESVASSVDLGPADFRMVTVALDSDRPEALAAAAAKSGADGEIWRWAGASDEVLRDVVGSGFRVYYDATQPDDVAFDPTFIIVDGTGLVRGEYPYATIASDADRLTRHVGILGEEILFAKGNNALIYEAAHIFLCYP